MSARWVGSMLEGIASRSIEEMARQSKRPKRHKSVKIVRIGVCDRCLQYTEDCECCPECGGSDVHEHGCGEATTRASEPGPPPRTPPPPKPPSQPSTDPRGSVGLPRPSTPEPFRPETPTLQGLGRHARRTLQGVGGPKLAVVRVDFDASGVDSTGKLKVTREDGRKSRGEND